MLPGKHVGDVGALVAEDSQAAHLVPHRLLGCRRPHGRLRGHSVGRDGGRSSRDVCPRLSVSQLRSHHVDPRLSFVSDGYRTGSLLSSVHSSWVSPFFSPFNNKYAALQGYCKLRKRISEAHM